MRAGTLLAVLLVLGGCDRPRDPGGMSDGVLAAELQRCRALGLKAYDSQACRAAQQERERRFLAPAGDRR